MRNMTCLLCVFVCCLLQGCFLEQWEQPEVKNANFIFFNNSSGWFNNSKALASFFCFSAVVLFRVLSGNALFFPVEPFRQTFKQ